MLGVLQQQRRAADRYHGSSVRRRLKHLLLGRLRLFPWFVPDFLIVSRRTSVLARTALFASTPIESILSASSVDGSTDIAAGRVETLTCRPFSNKHILKIVGPDGSLKTVGKVANVRQLSPERVSSAFAALGTLRRHMAASNSPLAKTIPAPIALRSDGNLIFSVEAAIDAPSYEDLCLDPSYFHDRPRVLDHLALVTDWILAFNTLSPPLLNSVTMTIPNSWLSLDGRPADGTYSWHAVQHGDLVPCNVLIDELTRHLWVIDWDQMAAGYPPLFDLFSLVHGLYYTPPKIHVPAGRSLDVVSALHTFCEQNWFAKLVLDSCEQLCRAFGLSTHLLERYFLGYLAARHHFYRQSSNWGYEHPLADDFRTLYIEISTGRLRTLFQRFTQHSGIDGNPSRSGVTLTSLGGAAHVTPDP